MLKQLVALLHLSLSDLGTSEGFATEVLTTSTDKTNLFARNFSCNSTIDDGSQKLTDFPSPTELKISPKNITAKVVSHAIYDLDASKATGPD